MKTYSILYSSWNFWIYCSRNNIDIQSVTEEDIVFLKLKFPNEISTPIPNSNFESQILKSDLNS